MFIINNCGQISVYVVKQIKKLFFFIILFATYVILTPRMYAKINNLNVSFILFYISENHT